MRKPGLATLALTLALGAAQAWAHAKPVQQSPAANANGPAPKAVSLAFSEAIEPAFSSLTITDATGNKINTAKATVDEASHKTLSTPLPPLPAGSYIVTWAVVAHDGHRSHGSYRFTVK